MAFALYTDENMTQKVGNILSVLFDANGQNKDYTFYFGNPTAGTKLVAQDGGNVRIAVTDALTDWVAQTAYALDAVCEPVGGNGWLYQCITAGTSGASAPRWLTVAGSSTTDGTVVWRCVGNRHQTSAIKLALSAGDLANGTSSVDLGAEVRAGAAVAIHVRINNAVAQLYTLPFVPQLALSLNECAETAA